MNFKKRLSRYLTFALGALACAIGIALITRAGLGTSPVSSTPFVLSLITPASMGALTFSFNVLFLVSESLLLKKIGLWQGLQLVATVFFSLCLDTAMAIIPTRYGGPWLDSAVYLFLGCTIMSFGISLEVRADVIMLPAEAFVRAVSKRTGKEFGNVKVCFDCTLTLLAAVLALVTMGRLNGVREGTVISSLLVGQLVKLWGRLFRKGGERRKEKSAHSAST